MSEIPTKRQLRYLREQERKGRERWAAMTEEEREEEVERFSKWLEARCERIMFLGEIETMLEDAHVRARNRGLFESELFRLTLAQFERNLRARLEEHRRPG